MASVKSGPFQLSGKIGRVVFKQLNGETYASSMPINFKMSNSPASVNNREVFGLTNALSKALMKVEVIRTLWRDSTLPGKKGYTRSFKVNYPIIKEGRGPVNFQILPVTPHISVNCTGAALQKNILTLNIILPSEPDYLKEELYPEISAQGIIYMTGPSDEKQEYSTVIPILSATSKLKKPEPIEFRIPILNQDFEIYKMYTLRTFVINLIAWNQFREPCIFSENFSPEISVS